MRKPGQQEPQAHVDGHEALQSDVQNGELPQQEVPMLEEVAMQNEELTQQEVPSQEEVAMQNQNRYPRRNRRRTIMELCRTLNILESQPFRRGSSVTGGSNNLGCRS